MAILRTVGASLLGVIFYSALSSWLIVAPLASKLRDPATPKQWLEESRAAQQLAPVIANQVVSSSDLQSNLPLSPAELTTILQDALPEETLRGYGNDIVSVVYAWFRGETAQPQFAISLSDRQDELEGAFSRLIQEKLTAAPRCTARQLQAGYDPLQDVCLPAGQSSSAVARTYTRQLFARGSPLEGARLDSRQILPVEATPGETHPAQRVYAGLAALPWLLLGLVLVSGAVLIVLSQPRRRGVQRLARRALTASLLVSIGAAFFTFMLPRLLNRTDLSFGREAFNVSAVVQPLVETASRDLAAAVYVYSLPVLLASVATLLGIWRLSKARLHP